MAFAAKHAEVIFIASHKAADAKKKVDQARESAKDAGRDPASLKVLALLLPVVSIQKERFRRGPNQQMDLFRLVSSSDNSPIFLYPLLSNFFLTTNRSERLTKMLKPSTKITSSVDLKKEL